MHFRLEYFFTHHSEAQSDRREKLWAMVLPLPTSVMLATKVNFSFLVCKRDGGRTEIIGPMYSKRAAIKTK